MFIFWVCYCDQYSSDWRIFNYFRFFGILELPWDRPCMDCDPYRTWKEGRFLGHPWSKLDVSALNFMKRILCPQASKRITIEQIRAHPWMNKRPGACKFKFIDFRHTLICDKYQVTKRLKSQLTEEPASYRETGTGLCFCSGTSVTQMFLILPSTVVPGPEGDQTHRFH